MFFNVKNSNFAVKEALYGNNTQYRDIGVAVFGRPHF